MSIWTCRKCMARYAVGMIACPQCQSTDYTDDPNALTVAEAPPTRPATAPRGTKAAQQPDAPAGALETVSEPAQDGGTP